MDDRRLSPNVRHLYLLLLRTVADNGADESSGSFPDVSDMRLGGDPASYGTLVDAGLIEYDAESGLVGAVMPLVAQTPSIRVLLDGDERLGRDAAGTLDGFALASLLARRVSVVDACLVCGQPVTVSMDTDRIRSREPRSCVVVRVPSDNSRQGRYDMARLACSPEHAQKAIETLRNQDAVIQSLEALYIESRDQYRLVSGQ